VTGRPETVTTLAFSPSGGLLAGGDVNHTPYVVPWRYGTVAIWDAASGRLLWKARSKRGWVTSVSFSPDGQKVAAGDESGAVVVYSASSGRELGRVKVEGGGDLTYLAVGWTRDGTLLTGSWSGIVQRWDAHRFRELGKPTLVAAAPVASLAVDPVDAMFATTGGSDGLAKLWTSASVQELGSSFTGPRAEWSNAAFTSDGSRLVVVYENGTGAVWPTSLAAWEQHACNVAGRNFTHEEWRRFVGGEPYRATCPRQPAVSGS
jgi:WD40 repeat protein